MKPLDLLSACTFPSSTSLPFIAVRNSWCVQYDRWLVHVVAVPLVLFGLVGCHWLVKRCRADEDQRAAVDDNALSRAFFVVMLLYPRVSAKVSKSFQNKSMRTLCPLRKPKYGLCLAKSTQRVEAGLPSYSSCTYADPGAAGSIDRPRRRFLLPRQIFAVLQCLQLGPPANPRSVHVLEADYSLSCETTRHLRFKAAAIILVGLVPIGV
eukprot:SAG31_NODE_1677_length_7533_cov_2.288054_2_plen_209_part_00